MSIDSMDTPPIDEPPMTPQRALSIIVAWGHVFGSEAFMAEHNPAASNGLVNMLRAASYELPHAAAVLRAEIARMRAVLLSIAVLGDDLPAAMPDYISQPISIGYLRQARAALEPIDAATADESNAALP